jgi:hypothetical protein
VQERSHATEPANAPTRVDLHPTARISGLESSRISARPPWLRSCSPRGAMAPSAIDLQTPHTTVHRLARRFLEPIQDILVLAIGVALFGLMARTLVRPGSVTAGRP